MKFQVPQFIDMDDKIFGPLSFKEFAYIAGACGLAYILYRFIPSTFVAFLFMAPVLTFGGLLAFYRPNNKPFIEMVQSALIYAFGNKLYIWKKEKKIISPIQMDEAMQMRSDNQLPVINSNKLTHLGWSLDTQKKDE